MAMSTSTLQQPVWQPPGRRERMRGVPGPGGSTRFAAERARELGKTGVALFLACFGNDAATVRRLLGKHLFSSPADVNLHTRFDGQEVTPLRAAIRGSDRGLIELLLSAGATISGLDFGEAVDLGRVDVAQMLLEHGFEPGAATGGRGVAGLPMRERLLMNAAERGDVPAITFLADHGANVNCERRFGNVQTPLTMAVGGNHLQAVAVLTRRGARITADALYDADRGGEADVLEQLLTSGGDPDSTKFGRSLLHHAVEYGGAGCVRVLLAAGARVDAVSDDGGTPLHLAAATGDAESVRLLLARGADPKSVDRGEQTPLAKAFAAGRYEVAKMLVPPGSEIHTCPEDEHDFGMPTYLDETSHRQGCRKCGHEIRAAHGSAERHCNDYPCCNDHCYHLYCPACNGTLR